MYCTQQDLPVAQDVLVTLTDDEGTGLVNAERVNAAIQAASDEIDAYARARYSVPFNPVPGIVKKLCADIALYNLISRRGYDEQSADRSVVDRYRAAIRFLENLVRGTVTIGAEAPRPAGETIIIESARRKFSRDRLEGY